MRWLTLGMFTALLILSTTSWAQTASQESSQESMTGFAYCTYADGRQVSVRYNQPEVKKDAAVEGKLWLPGGTRMDLFTETPLVIGGKNVPIGAFAMYFIPGRSSWTLVVNKNVTNGAPYNEQEDLARDNMPTEKLGYVQDKLLIYFGHVQPKVCVMRVDYGKGRSTVNITQQ